MRILQLTPHIDSRGGGVSEVVLNLSNALSARGNEVRTIGRIQPSQVTTVTARAPMVTPAETSTSVARIVATTDQTLLHSHGLWVPYLNAGLRAARARRVPTVISPHGMLDDWALTQGRLKKWLALTTYEGRNLAQAKVIHALTRAEARTVRRLVPHVPIAVIPNGVHLPTTAPIIEGEDKVLLFLGRIHPKKGILDLVTAFAHVIAEGEGTNWRLVVAGWDDGDHQAQIKARIAELGIHDRVSLPGPVFGSDKERLLASSTAFALTSFSEGLPMAVLEAWAQAKPILMTPECNLTEAACKGAALICETGAEAVAAGLRRLFAMSSETRAKMGQIGRAVVATHYDWEQVSAAFESLYAWLRDESKQPRPEFIIGVDSTKREHA